MHTIILGSGSKGNSTLLMDGETNILIDVGFSYPKMKILLENINSRPENIDAILITHSHKDHILGLASFVKKNNVKVYVNRELSIEIEKIVPSDYIVLIDDLFYIKNILVNTIKTSHDSIGSVGFILDNGNTSMVYITDTGYINKRGLAKIVNKSIYVLESNHDVEMLMNGPYPYILKQRVLSDKGHLSNELAGNYLNEIIGNNTRKIVLAHLSETNNTHEMAYETVKSILGNKLDKIELVVASQEESLDMGNLDD